jgi:spoIIIJ-associated protein
MISPNEIEKVKEVIQELLQKMGIEILSMQADVNSFEAQDHELKNQKDYVVVNVIVEEPQMVIGQNGQTLFELQRILKILLYKKLQKDFYLSLDINEYKKKKIEYIKHMANTLADEVAATKEKRVMVPMSSYERRIIHTELSGRQDIITQSQGKGFERYIEISPR